MLAVTIRDLPFANPLKGRGDRPINALQVLQSYACGFDVPCAISCLNGLVSPTYLGMVLQVAGRPGIALI
jgi:hypothetical protein